MPKISADSAMSYLLGSWVLGTLASHFWCIVMTPVILMIVRFARWTPTPTDHTVEFG